MTYLDLYLLPVPERHLDAYAGQATTFGAVALELGALSYREFRDDDVRGELRPAAGDALMVGIVEFASRADRDAIMDRVLQDPRVEAGMQGEQLADMSAMRYGGFTLLVDPATGGVPAA